MAEASLVALLNSIKITQGDKFNVYKLPTTNTIINLEKSGNLIISEYGTPSSPPKPSKVLLLVGATGAGKTTWINRLANHLMGVGYDDKVRYMLIEEESRSQAYSQTQEVTVYKFHHSPLDYTLVIIDTPGFGDTRGLERDQEITAQIREAIELTGCHSIHQIHGIGFVIPAHSARLDSTMKHVFQSIFTMFGKNIKEVILALTTFADGEDEPLALAAIREADIPYTECFKFNNKALYKQEKSRYNRMYWEDASESFEKFLTWFGRNSGASLEQTREVLKQHGLLEDIQKSLRYQMKEIIEELHEIEGHRDVLPYLSNIVEEKRRSTMKSVVIEVPLDEGVKVTNCVKCKYTCHANCTCDTRKYWCRCINLRGYCRVCPAKCSHKKHVNNGIIYKNIRQTSLKKTTSYTNACNNKVAQEEKIAALTEKRERHIQELKDKIREACDIQQQLNEIALKSSSLTEIEYINLLIESENSEKEVGWDIRVLYYRQLKTEKEREIMELTESDQHTLQNLEESTCYLEGRNLEERHLVESDLIN